MTYAWIKATYFRKVWNARVGNGRWWQRHFRLRSSLEALTRALRGEWLRAAPAPHNALIKL